MTAQTEELPAGLDREPYAGRYRLQALLGRGAAADVHRALDERLQRPVALKLFRPDAGAEAESRFAAEARLLARLHHPGLVEVYDYGSSGGRSYLALELVDGPPLRDLLLSGPLPPAVTARIGAALADALAHVHSRDIVHRDIKPSNVLVDAAGEPRLADFGLCRLVDGARMTATGMVVGTAAYLSPEQVRGQGATPASDVYALGLVLLECLTGRREYPGPTMESAVARLHRAPCIPDDAPAGLADTLRRMTADDPADRPDARACARLLAEPYRSRAAAVPPPVTTAADLTDPHPRHARRHLRRPVGVGVAALACAGLACTAVTLNGTSNQGRSQPAAPRGSHSTAASRPSATTATPAAPAAPAVRSSPAASGPPHPHTAVIGALTAAKPPAPARTGPHPDAPGKSHGHGNGPGAAKPPKPGQPGQPGKPGKPGKAHKGEKEDDAREDDD